MLFVLALRSKDGDYSEEDSKKRHPSTMLQFPFYPNILRLSDYRGRMYARVRGRCAGHAY